MTNTTQISNDTPDGQRILSDFVHQNVIHNVSRLISDLCSAGLYDNSCSFGELHSEVLCRDDYEEAARDEGWVFVAGEYIDSSDGTTWARLGAAWEDLCDSQGIEPYQVEALEHWIVSDWLAGKLADHEEMVGKDIHGLTIWGRTCSGQAIHLDGVIAAIYNELHESKG